jgi:hypothetical protein
MLTGQRREEVAGKSKVSADTASGVSGWWLHDLPVYSGKPCADKRHEY